MCLYQYNSLALRRASTMWDHHPTYQQSPNDEGAERKEESVRQPET